MSSKLELAGYNLKEWSLIILLISLGMVFAIIGAGFVLAIMANPTGITFTGAFDLSQFTAILIAVAGIAAVLVSQQLTHKQTLNAVSETDKTWLAESKSP